MGKKGLSKVLVDVVWSQKCIVSQKARAISAFRALKTIIEKCKWCSGVPGEERSSYLTFATKYPDLIIPGTYKDTLWECVGSLYLMQKLL